MSIDTSLGGNLIVPVVLWGRHAPTHQISSIYVTPDQRTLVTGCADGHIITWNVHPTTFQVNPYMLLVGHTSRVTCMSDGLLNTSHKYLVSAAVNGEMCAWDLQEGQCIETIKMSFIHRQIQAYQSAGNTDVTLFCCGEYADIALVHPLTLELIYWLSSRVSANWITSMHIFKPKAVADDVVMGVTVDGVVKIWTVSSIENGPSEGFHYENESKRIRCDDVRYLKCCSYNPRTVLVVTADMWQIYDACDFSLLCSYTSECDERWQQGEFLAADQVLVWAESGLAYVYNLPVNCIATHERFHSPSVEKDQPSLICRLSTRTQQRLHEPSCSLFVSYRGERQSRLLVRGDCTGQVAVWQLPQHRLAAPSPDPQSGTNTAPALSPSVQCSIQQAWNSMQQLPVGILDQLETEDCRAPRLTASLYLPLQEGHLVCGREDGTIIIVPATHTIMLHLLLGKHQNYDNWPIHQILSGHRGPVTSLLYPHSSHPRYHLSELVSGGEDFSVCLWDLLSGTLLHRFVVQAGVITQLHVPPDSVSPRIQQCVCSVAADHSVALLSVRERRCLMLAGRHLFPVLMVKWRPLDDFLVVETEDGSVSVWQMETGHLDRVVYGTTAQDVLSACDEHAVVVATSDGGMANPAVHLFRGLRHRNLAAIRHAAKRGLQQLQNQHGNMHGNSDQHKSRSSSLMVQGLRTNAKDPDCHVLFFDVESLIGLLARVKEGAETMGGIIHNKTAASDKIDETKDVNGEALRANVAAGQTVNQTMEICQILLSLVHSWGVDADIDKLCETRLGLLRPKLPVSYGLISKHGFMSLLLPTFLGGLESASLQERTRAFTRRTHWELSCALTTNHLLAVIALANTLMSVNHSSFLPPNERHRKLQKQLARTQSTVGTQVNGGKIPQDGLHELQANFWAQVKEGWSRMAALHCVHFPERMETGGVALKKPLVEILAIKWQDRCIEIRQAAQALLLAELHRLSTRALKAVVDAWASLLPSYGDQLTASTPQPPSSGASSAAAGAVVSSPALSASASHTAAAGDDVDHAAADAEVDDFIMEDQMEEEAARRAAANAAEARRKQATAVILLGVIGAEFGQEVSSSGSGSTSRTSSNAVAAGDRLGQNQTTPAVEGFGLGPLALHTSQALAHLLLAPPSAKLPAHTPLRRAAIDLIGRGFTQWEPHIDASRVLLAMLELSCEAHNLAPSMSYGLPLTPAADTARTARHAVALIAKARPHVFITTMAREVARYNTLQQNAQPLNVVVQHTVLVRARAEILRVTQLLIDTMHHQLMPFLIELTDILLHCLDSGHLRQRGLAEVFPAINRFNQITHCTNTRRLAVGTTAGVLAIYDLRQTSKTQLSAHSKAVTACAFSPDGKFLASYSTGENKISFWQTSTGMFGLGQSQTRCVKTYSTPPLADIVRMNPPRQPRLVWIANKTVTALLSDGTEQRYNV